LFISILRFGIGPLQQKDRWHYVPVFMQAPLRRFSRAASDPHQWNAAEFCTRDHILLTYDSSMKDF
jgi:hypothetical protein